LEEELSATVDDLNNRFLDFFKLLLEMAEAELIQAVLDVELIATLVAPLLVAALDILLLELK